MPNTPPELSGPPLIGHMLEFRSRRTALFRRGYDALGPVFTIRLGPQKAAVLMGPEYHSAFFDNTDTRLRMDKAYTMLRAALGEVAFTAPPDFYENQRPVLHEPFKGQKMPGYIAIMQQETQAWLDGLPNEGELELVEELTAVIQNVAAHAFMGHEFRDRLGEEFWRLFADVTAALDPFVPANLPLPKFIRRDRAKARIRAILVEIIHERRANPELHDDFLQDFVDAKFKDGTPLSDDHIVSLIMALMFAGHETTVGQAAWSVIQLLQNPDYLPRVRTELDRELPPGTPITPAVLRALPHVNYAVNETSRLHPSADLLFRYVEEPLTVDDYEIPAGWMVIVSSEAAQQLDTVFTQPTSYDPERFGPERAEDKAHRYNVISFGGGMHKCTGMNFAINEMSVIAALLFQQFELELLNPAPGVEYGLGAARPEKTRVRFKQRVRTPAGAVA